MQLPFARTSAAACRAPAARRVAVQPRLVSSPARRVQLRAATEVESKTEKKAKKEEEEPEFEDGPEVAPSTQQVQTFLNTLCGETTVAQVELKLGTFSMKVTRSIEAGAAAGGPVMAAPAPAPVAAFEPAPITVMTAGAGAIGPDESIDEALIYVTSPKVGIMRRGKYAAGKRIGKGELVKEGDTIRNGQTVAFVEQLGTFVEIKAPQGGEFVRFRVKEGEPVEYGQVVVEILPTFAVTSPSS